MMNSTKPQSKTSVRMIVAECSREWCGCPGQRGRAAVPGFPAAGPAESVASSKTAVIPQPVDVWRFY